jgi:hypothetical protein
MKNGRCGIMTHDYKRHGITRLFAALNTDEQVFRWINGRLGLVPSEHSSGNMAAGCFDPPR